MMQLKQYLFPEISVKANPDFDNGQSIDFESMKMNISPSVNPNDDKDYAVQIQLDINDKENAPYFISIVGVIFFSFDSKLDKEERDPKAFHNGSTVLYSAMREQIASLTSRNINGTLFLPAWYFKTEQFVVEENKHKGEED